MANTRRYRLELPAAPKTDDPKAIQKYLSDIRRLTMDEFNRLAGDFYSFREDVINSATIPLASVAAISVVASEYSAIFTWENPAQTQGLPTHVRVRIAEFGDTWAEYEYPLMTWTAHGLSPTTTYTFQIQLVRRAAASVSFVSALRNCPSIPVQVESTSEIRSRSFTTDGGLGPPTDDGTGGSVFPIPDVDGTPGPPGGANCWWEWQVQYVNLTTGEWMDTTYWGTVAGDAGEIDFDITVLDPMRVYRIKYREVCNGVPGAWNYGEPFTGGSDWLGNCGGNDPSASILTSPYDTADLFAMPYACFVEGEGLFMREYLSGIQIVPGMGYGHIFADTNDEWTIVTDSWDDTDDTKLVGSTYLPALTTLDNTSDLSICIEILITALPTDPTDGFRTATLLDIGDGRIQFHIIYSDAGVWGVRVEAVRENGGQFVWYETPSRNDGIEFGSVLIFLVSDANGDKYLIVDGSVVALDITGEEMRLDNMSGAVQIRGFAGMFIRKIYGWTAVIDAAITPASVAASSQAADQAQVASINTPDSASYTGSLGVLFVGHGSSTGISGPAGWTQHANDGTVAVFSKVLGAETLIELDGPPYATAMILCIVDDYSIGVVDVSSIENENSGAGVDQNDVEFPDDLIANKHDLILAWAHFYGTLSVPPTPTDMALVRRYSAHAGLDETAGVFAATAVSTGTVNFAEYAGNAPDWSTIAVAIR